jgi:hypothetical protein
VRSLHLIKANIGASGQLAIAAGKIGMTRPFCLPGLLGTALPRANGEIARFGLAAGTSSMYTI